jgi:hypothetical protein
MLLLFFGAPSAGLAIAISETGDSILLRVTSAVAETIDPNFRVSVRPRRRTVIPVGS